MTADAIIIGSGPGGSAAADVLTGPGGRSSSWKRAATTCSTPTT